MATHTIGTGGDYATIQAWEADQNVGVFTADVIGECKAEDLYDNYYITITGGTPGAFWLRLRAEAGAEHDGRAFSVSGVACARYYDTLGYENIYISGTGQPNIEISWMDFSATGVANMYVQGNGPLRLHHNIVSAASPTDTTTTRGAHFVGANPAYSIYRNIFFGHYFHAIQSAGYSAVETILQNTVLYSGRGYTGIANNAVNASYLLENNAVFAASTCIGTGIGTQDNNATTDATGDAAAGLTNLTAAAQIKSASQSVSTFDCRIKDTDADIYQAGDATYSTATYPEIDVPITDRTATITGTWSVGADNDPSAGPVSANPNLLATAFCTGPL